MRYFVAMIFLFFISCNWFVKEKIVYVEKPIPIQILCPHTIKPDFSVTESKDIDAIALELGINIDKLKKYAKDLEIEINCIYESNKKLKVKE
jgi:hypothetical protein